MTGSNFGNREKFRIQPEGLQQDRARALDLYSRQEYNKAIDVYEQIVALYPVHAVELLAELYDLYMTLPQRDRYSLYQSRHFNFGISPGDKVLDIGSGHLPFPLATHLSDIALSDHQYGRAGIPFKHVDGKPVYECNVEAMPFADKEFDFVYCSHVLEHTKNPEKACQELMRIGKRGYIETPTKGKDIFLNSAAASNHTRYVEAFDNKLIFTDYTLNEINGFQHDILMQMHTNPQTAREKAFSVLIWLKADLSNTMFLWEGAFDYEIRSRNSSSPKQSTATVSDVKDIALKLMQIHGFYPSYIDTFYREYPDTASLPFIEQTNRLVRDGYSANHIIAPYMDQFGYETHLVFANNPFTQEKWMAEQGFTVTDRKNWIHEIVRTQIDTIKPDILYLSDPITFEGAFVRSLSWKPALIVGWRAANIPEGTDWTGFDVMLSSLASLREVARLLGAKRAEHFHPGYPAWINGLITDQKAEYDVIFSGSWTSAQHEKRNAYLKHIATASEINGFSCAYYLTGELHSMPPAVARFNKGGKFGIAMHRALRSGKIVIDARGSLEIKNVGNTIDLAKSETANMRIFEVTGAGCFLLTEYHENLRDYFQLGVEIETFRNERELVDKINYYLAHPVERDAIARRGQERCLRDYSMEMQARKFDAIVRNTLNAESVHHKSDLHTTGNTPEDPYDTAYRWGWNNPELRQLVYLCFKTPDMADNARRFFMSEGFREAVLLLSSLGKSPRSDIRLLDLGCGNGVASYALARTGYDVTGLDSSLGELAGLKAAAHLNGLDGARFSLLHSTGESLDFPDEHFDVIWMREVLHHIRDLNAFMREAARILKPGGIICCLREHVIWNESQREHFFRTHPFYHITGDEGCYYLHEYLEAFKGADLSVEKLLAPSDSVINTYPAPFTPGLIFDPEAAKLRSEGNDLFSFFAKKLAPISVNNVSRGNVIETGNSVILDSFNLQATGLKEGHTYFKTGDDCMIGAEMQILSPDAEITVGDRVYLSAGSRVVCCNKIEFGNDILVAWGCTFIDHDAYPMKAEARKGIMRGKLERLRGGEKNWDRPELACVTRGKITIGDHAWIGMNCVVSGGVTIGEGAVVGACSVVTDDVEPWTVVIGNPARRII